MNWITLLGLIILVLSVSIHLIFLNRNISFKKHANGMPSPYRKPIIITGILNLVGIIILIIGLLIH